MTTQSKLRIGLMTATMMLASALQCPAAAQPVATGTFTREAMMRDIVRNCIVPAYQQLASNCRDLTNAIGELAKAPSQSTFDNARSAWVAASLSASRVRCVQVGPMGATGSGYGPAFYYFAVMPNLIEEKIASTHPIDSSWMDEMGATTKGMFALEYLLFGAKSGPNAPRQNLAPPLQLLSASNAQRRRDCLVLLARDLETKAGTLEKAWLDPGSQGIAATFVNAGQTNLNQLVNTIAVALEDVSDRHLHLALLLPKPLSRQLYRIERSPSGTSVQSLVAILESAQKIYRNANGLALIDAVKQVNLPTATVLEQRFDDALAATRALGAPLDQAIVDSPVAVTNAFEKTHALEVKFKVDLVSTLGVTLTFSSADGD